MPSRYNGELLSVQHSLGPDITQELAEFGFEEREALVTRSQLEGADILLPSRFVDVRALSTCFPWELEFAVTVKQRCHSCLLQRVIRKGWLSGTGTSASVQSHKWDYSRRRRQHPCFTTSNYAYGMKNPLKADMPMTWHGAQGEFTKTFAGPPRDRGLRCWLETSKVHRAFDEF